MPLVRKRRIWWESVPEATGYAVYASRDSRIMNPANFSRGDTPNVISKSVIGKTGLVLPDEWPEFPSEPGTYHIAITTKDDVENESDPLFLSGLFKFVAPRSPSRGGVECLPVVHQGSEIPSSSLIRDGRTIIQGGLEEVKNNKEVWDAYFGDN